MFTKNADNSTAKAYRRGMSLKSLIVGILAGLLIGGMPASADETTAPEPTSVPEVTTTTEVPQPVRCTRPVVTPTEIAFRVIAYKLTIQADRMSIKIQRRDQQIQQKAAKIAELRERLRNR